MASQLCFDLYGDYLRSVGVEVEQIIRINLEDPDLGEIDDWKKLYGLIKNQLVADKMNYIFIDEVQNVPDFQKAVDGLFIKPNCDVYVTGSNAYLLSSELSTYLFGPICRNQDAPPFFQRIFGFSWVHGN